MPAIPRQTRGFAPDVLAGVVASVWSRRLAVPLEMAGIGARSDFTVSAGLPLETDPEHGHLVVFLCLPEDVARAAAAQLLGLLADELSPADIDDAFVELIEQVGDEMRRLMPEVAPAGQAFVVHGTGLGAANPGAGLLCEAGLRCSAGRVHVSLWGPRPIRVPRQATR